MSVEILDKTTLHDGWARYSVLRVRLPDGQTAKRELEEHGPAVAVLPYDAERGTAILVRQFRAPVLAATGEATLTEAIAGLTDGEAPDEAARREVFEETGVQLKALEPVGTLWTMPGRLHRADTSLSRALHPRGPHRAGRRRHGRAREHHGAGTVLVRTRGDGRCRHPGRPENLCTGANIAAQTPRVVRLICLAARG
jgi:8-oxo-dGTP pyrophosphatase MutT (NUDIX family)